jgi:hypothetical protein
LSVVGVFCVLFLVGVEPNPGPPKATAAKIAKAVVKEEKKMNQPRKHNNQGQSGTGFRRVTMGDVGASLGNFIGESASRALSAITGFGDYTVTENTLYQGAVSSNGPPAFVSKSPGCSRILHREYVCDISSVGAAFNLLVFAINPTNINLFPWLAQIAVQFESYRFRGLVFEFKTTSATAVASTNTALGTVILATQYNIDDPGFTNKLQMEQYEYAVSSVPFMSCIHPVECARGSGVLDYLYTYLSAQGDARMTTFGQFNIATVGQQAAANIGELWVSYDIELCKPRLGVNPETLGFHASWANSGGISYPSYSDFFAIANANVVLDPGNTLRVIIGTAANNGTGNRVIFPVTNPGTFLVTLFYTTISGATMTIGVPTVGNGAVKVDAFTGFSSGAYTETELIAPNSGVSAALGCTSVVVSIPPGLVQASSPSGSPYLQYSVSTWGSLGALELVVQETLLQF